MSKFAAGIVLYNPEAQHLIKNIEHIIDQVEYLVLVDNNSYNISEIEDRYNGNEKIKIICNEDNKGIAHALNQIVMECDKKGFQWVLTLDQDSVCPKDLIKVYGKYINLEDVALLTPTINDINESKTNHKHLQEYEYVERCITSGNLLNVQICKSISYFDEKMFIDYVDFDYCIRLINEGYKIIRVNKVKIDHEVGKAQKIVFIYNIGKFLHVKKFQKYFYTYNHSPIRTYYYTRNTIYYIRKHKNSIKPCEEYKILAKWALLKIIAEDMKIKKISSIAKGIKDGRNMKI